MMIMMIRPITITVYSLLNELWRSLSRLSIWRFVNLGPNSQTILEQS